MQPQFLEETEQLLAWYDQNHRTLPWREDPTPYHVWLSEIMLQQTRVSAVIEYYHRFLAELPDIRALAQAPEDTYMKLWEGLGYYSRVRNLHKAAVLIEEEYDGRMPRTKKELMGLPGIGDYTASAIASIVFQEDTPAIDGNLLRIFARRTSYPEDIKAGAAKKEALQFYQARISDMRPGEYNQALMDLGATICLPNGMPLCASCPWCYRCSAHASAQETRYPYVIPKNPRRIEKKSILLVHDDTSVLLAKRPKKGLLAGLYEFPSVPSEDGIRAIDAWMESVALPRSQYQETVSAKHIFSHIEWHMKGYEIRVADLNEIAKPLPAPFLIAKFEELEERYAIPSAFRAYLNQLKEIRKEL